MEVSKLCCIVLVSALLLLVMCYPEGAAGGFYIRLKKHTSSKAIECRYNGYVPGGGAIKIDPIPSPVAKGFENSLGFVAKIIGQGAGAGRALAAVAATIEKTAKIASKLSAGFGVFASAFGIIEAFTKPTPNQILEKVNKAFAEMAKDVNDRLKKMEGYVDGKIIKAEEGIIKNEFAYLKRYFGSCIRETTEEAARRCQRNANKNIYAELSKFQKLRNHFSAGKKTGISFYDVKRLEAGLISFRDYASLHLYSLQLLVNTYREDRESLEKNRRLHLYLGDLKTLGRMYYNYANWAYQVIYQRQVKENLDSRGRLRDQTKFGKYNTIKEGWFVPKHTADSQDVIPNCTPGNKHSPINRCKYHLTIRRDGKSVGYPYRRYYVPVRSNDYRAAVAYLGRRDSGTTCRNYLNSLKRDLQTFWKKELLDPADMWNRVADKAAKDLEDMSRR